MDTTEARAVRAVARDKDRQRKRDEAVRLRNAGRTNTHIAQALNISEASVRSLLKP